MSLIKRFVEGCIKTFAKLKVKLENIVSPIIEAARTISYVETVSNKADTLHRYVKQADECTLKRAFEFNTRKAIGRMGLGKTTLAVDATQEIYYGKNGKLNVRQKKFEKGADEAFTYVVLSVVKPLPLPLMALPYRQGDDLTALVKELLEYVKSLPITIQLILFDRGFYIGDLIACLSSANIRYLIFVPQNKAMKRYISQTKTIDSFNHTIKYNKRKSWWKVQTRIDIIKDATKNYFWCFATNLRQSLYLISKYKQRWQIETDFRVHDEARIKTKSNEPIVRYFYFLMSLILLSNWEVNRLLDAEVCFKKYLKFVQEKFEKEIT